MVINIDIKIADDEGRILKRFEKQFGDDIIDSENFFINKQLDRSFEDFLSEYMSVSGRTLRERLAPLNKTVFDPSPVKTTISTEMKKKNIAAGSGEGQTAMDNPVNFAMRNAIDKYEANLCPISMEQEYQRLEAALTEVIQSPLIQLEQAPP